MSALVPKSVRKKNKHLGSSHKKFMEKCEREGPPLTTVPVRCVYSEIVPIDKLKPHKGNHNHHSKEQITRLANIIEYQGWRKPIVVSKRSGLITSGHGRLLAAIEKGWAYVPINLQEYDSEEQEYADVQADNAIASWAELDLAAINADLPDLGPDLDIDMLGIKDFVLEPADKFHGDEDEVPEVDPKTPTTKLGELYQLGEHRLLCGDCTDPANVARLMSGEKADMVFTDPPYGDATIIKTNEHQYAQGIGNVAAPKKYRKYDGDSTFKCENLFFIIEPLAKWHVVWGGNSFTDSLPVSRSWAVWDKAASDEGGNWFSDFELAWTDINMAQFKIRHIHQGMIVEGGKEEKVHPTQKPIAMIEKFFDRIMKSHKGNPKLDFIVDIFLGSGSTLIACEKTNRKCYGMEIDPHYCSVVIERWMKFTGKMAYREDGKSWEEISVNGGSTTKKAKAYRKHEKVSRPPSKPRKSGKASSLLES